MSLTASITLATSIPLGHLAVQLKHEAQTHGILALMTSC